MLTPVGDDRVTSTVPGQRTRWVSRRIRLRRIPFRHLGSTRCGRPGSIHWSESVHHERIWCSEPQWGGPSAAPDRRAPRRSRTPAIRIDGSLLQPLTLLVVVSTPPRLTELSGPGAAAPLIVWGMRGCVPVVRHSPTRGVSGSSAGLGRCASGPIGVVIRTMIPCRTQDESVVTAAAGAVPCRRLRGTAHPLLALRRGPAVAQSDPGGGSNKASSAASGTWKSGSHPSRSARRIG